MREDTQVFLNWIFLNAPRHETKTRTLENHKGAAPGVDSVPFPALASLHGPAFLLPCISELSTFSKVSGKTNSPRKEFG